MEFRKLVQPIAEAIALTFDAPVDEILTANLDSEGIVFGQLLSEGKFYSYASNGNEVVTSYHQDATDYLDEYAKGFLNNINIHVDSSNTYDYACGFFRVDAQVKCSQGNQPCGNRCISRKKRCRKNMKNPAKNAMRQGLVSLKNPANQAFGAAAGIAGTVGTAVLMGAGMAAGSALYENRETIMRDVQSGIDKAKQRIQGK
jgi:hypothetical protein